VDGDRSKIGALIFEWPADGGAYSVQAAWARIRPTRAAFAYIQAEFEC